MKDREYQKAPDRPREKGGGAAPDKEDPRERIDRMIHRLRDNPEEFQDIRRKFHTADSDEERVNLLIDFATSDERLTHLVPSGLQRGDELAATVTTVTVTTVTIPDTAY